VATNRNTLINKLATLAPNTGLLVNISPSVEINGITYGRGDVVYCDFNGEKHHIKGASGGYYYPQDFAPVGEGATNTFKMVYRFASTLPSSGVGSMEANATPYETMEKTVNVSAGNNIYFGQYTINAGASKELNLIQDGTIFIYPLIRIYYKHNDGRLEEILYDKSWVSYNLTTKKFNITNPCVFAIIVELT
jgi:hypothetical protein